MVNVGTIVTFQNPAPWRRPWPEVYADQLRYTELAEQLGVDQVWLAEHHFSDDGFLPSLMPAAAAIAARTTTLRIGTKVMLLPLHDPVRLAEDIAVVDQLSNGRLDVGLAAGYRKAEFDAFGLRHDERGKRMDEGLEVLTRALAGETFSFDGKYMQYGEVHIVPEPVQRPIPLWLGGRAPASMRRAVRYAANLPLADFNVKACKADLASYQSALRKEGKDPADFSVAGLVTVCVNESAERAWELAEPHIRFSMNQYVTWFNETSDRGFGSGMLESARELTGPGAMVGTPDQVLRQILDYHAEVPFTHLTFGTYLPGMDNSAAVASLRLFCAEVLPHLRSELP